MNRHLFGLLALCGVCLLDGCGETSTPPPPIAATQLLVRPAASTITAGTVMQFTVTAADGFGTLAPSYAGTVHFTSSDSQAVLPADSKLTNGTGSFSATLKTAGGESLSATDSIATSLAGSANITVNAGPATVLSVTATSAATVLIPFNVSVNAVDAYANLATSYAGTVHFTSSDPQAVLPANTTLNGSSNFSVILKSLGPQTVTATDTVTASLKGSTSPINMVSNAATHLSFSGNPGSTLTRQTFGFTVTAMDAANNTSTGYAGTVHFTSSDAQAKLPANTTLAGGSSSNLSATLETAGTQTLIATDISSASISGSSSLTVTAAANLTITSAAPPAGTVGSPYNPRPVRYCVFFILFHCQRFVLGQSDSFPLAASGGIPPDTWSWGPAPGSSLPPGLFVANAGNFHCGVIGVLNSPRPPCIYGTPTQPGTFNVVLTATDGGSPVAQTPANYTITINNPAPPAVNTAAPPPAVENHPYSFTFAASGYPPLTWSESGSLPAGLKLDSGTGTLSGTPTQTGSFPISVTATDQFNQSSPAADFTMVVSAHGFLATGDMTTARSLHTATLLSNGKVLVAGGQQVGTLPIAAVELYDPAAGTFASTGDLQTARAAHTATLLTSSGKVLVAGGLTTDSVGTATATAELYDPASGTFSSTGGMAAARSGHTATFLSNGNVLIVGGKGSNGTPAALSSAELYNPATGLFTTTGSLATARTAHTATLLANGKVLVAGGTDVNGKGLVSAELYDPTAGTFSAVTGTMVVARAQHTAVLFTSGPDSGKVLLAGGLDSTGKASNTAELFDPTAMSFTATANMVSAHAAHTGTLLNDGTVLLAGGVDATGSPTAVAELFDPTSGNFSVTGSLVTAREEHTATLLANGHVLTTGGLSSSAGTVIAIASAEVYQ